jgi:hypothetical protein
MRMPQTVAGIVVFKLSANTTSICQSRLWWVTAPKTSSVRAMPDAAKRCWLKPAKHDDVENILKTKQIVADYTAKNLYDAAKWILANST